MYIQHALMTMKYGDRRPVASRPHPSVCTVILIPSMSTEVRDVCFACTRFFPFYRTLSGSVKKLSFQVNYQDPRDLGNSFLSRKRAVVRSLLLSLLVVALTSRQMMAGVYALRIRLPDNEACTIWGGGGAFAHMRDGPRHSCAPDARA